ncbi:hypothetical protein CR513_03310, partial [Mucuna pruriens]
MTIDRPIFPFVNSLLFIMASYPYESSNTVTTPANCQTTERYTSPTKCKIIMTITATPVLLTRDLNEGYLFAGVDGSNGVNHESGGEGGEDE